MIVKLLTAVNNSVDALEYAAEEFKSNQTKCRHCDGKPSQLNDGWSLIVLQKILQRSDVVLAALVETPEAIKLLQKTSNKKFIWML
jgi:hypothetical protein